MPDIFSTKLKATPKNVAFVAGRDNSTRIQFTHDDKPIDLSDFTFELSGLSDTPINDSDTFEGTTNGKLYINGANVTKVGEEQDFILRGSSPSYGDILFIHPSIPKTRVKAVVLEGPQ